MRLPAQVIDQDLVNLNGEIITRRQLDERVRSVLAQQQGRTMVAELEPGFRIAELVGVDVGLARFDPS